MEPATTARPDTNITEPSEPPIMMSGLYWYKWLLDKTAKPVILTLQDNLLSLETRDAVIFRAPTQNVAVRFTKITLSMVLVVNGQKFELRQNAALFSPRFSNEQLAKLQTFASPGNLAREGVGAVIAGGATQRIAQGAVGQVAGAGLEAAGVVATAVAIKQSEDTFRRWQTALASGGVPIKQPNYRGVNIYVKIVVGFIVLVLALQMLVQLHIL